MRTIDFDALRPVANADFEFRNAARSWSATVRFDIGAEVHTVTVKGGEIVDAGPDGAFSYDVRIVMTSETWHEMMAPVPRPFYHDLSAARLHGLQIEAAPEVFGPYYPALRRLVELAREQATEESCPLGTRPARPEPVEG